MRRRVQLCGTDVLRLGLASRGNTHLSRRDVEDAVSRGVGYLNWCTHEDGMSEAIAGFDAETRSRVVVAAQFHARTEEEAKRELDAHRKTLGLERIDVLTLYYVESQSEWTVIERGALPVLRAAKERGEIQMIGLTTHQRPLAARWAEHLDLLMIRYNAAHRGAESDVFPHVDVPIVAFTCLRWGGLMRRTPDDPPGFEPPAAPEWYRFVLSEPNVSVALMAPKDRAELQENLSLLGDWRPPIDRGALASHGDRVKRHAGAFL